MASTGLPSKTFGRPANGLQRHKNNCRVEQETEWRGRRQGTSPREWKLWQNYWGHLGGATQVTRPHRMPPPKPHPPTKPQSPHTPAAPDPHNHPHTPTPPPQPQAERFRVTAMIVAEVTRQRTVQRVRRSEPVPMAPSHHGVDLDCGEHPGKRRPPPGPAAGGRHGQKLPQSQSASQQGRPPPPPRLPRWNVCLGFLEVFLG